MNKTLLSILLTLLPYMAISQYTDVINSNKPGESFSAFSVGVNVLQIETGVTFLKEKHDLLNSKFIGYGLDFSIRYGFFKEELEFLTYGTYQNDIFYDYRYNPTQEINRKNFKEFKIAVKYLIYDPYKDYEDIPNVYSYRANQKFKWRSLIPAVATMAGVNIDTEGNPYTTNGIKGVSPFFLITTQNNFKNNTVLITNLILDRLGSNQTDFEYIITLTKALNMNWVIFAETQGIKSDFYADNLFSIGTAYLFNKDLQMDGSLTTNNKNTPKVSRLNLGLSYRFDFHKDKAIER
jgi:hypothetical protein